MEDQISGEIQSTEGSWYRREGGAGEAGDGAKVSQGFPARAGGICESSISREGMALLSALVGEHPGGREEECGWSVLI